MKIGVKLPNSGPLATAGKIRTAATEIERLGYDSLWVHDHLHRKLADAKKHFVAGSIKQWEAWEGPMTPNVFESITTLFYVAGLTRNMQVGTSICVLPLRNPVWLAKMVACLDQFTGGRFIFGVGAGGGPYIEDELRAAGHPERFEPRLRVVDEWIAVMRKVWTESVVDFDGEFISIEGAEVFPKPVQKRLPVVYGGTSKSAMTRIARELDGWLPMFKSPGALREEIEKLYVQTTEFGRDPSELTILSEFHMTIDEDHEVAVSRLEETRRELKAYIRQWDLPDTRWAKTNEDWNLSGNPESLLELLSKYQDVGVDHIILRVVADDLDQMIDQLAMFKETVMDRLGLGASAAT